MAQTATQAAPKHRVYWAPASDFQIGNFQPEIKGAGGLVQPERPMRFRNHVKSTANPEEIEFIEAYLENNPQAIKRVASMEEANRLTAQLGHIKRVTQIKAADVETQENPEVAKDQSGIEDV